MKDKIISAILALTFLILVGNKDGIVNEIAALGMILVLLK